MKNFYILYLLIIYPFFSTAQIAMAVVEDNKRSVLDYKVEWGFEFRHQCAKRAYDYLKSIGYEKNIHDRMILYKDGEVVITSGYYVVVKSTYTEPEGLVKTGIGMGVSSVSYEEATTRAIKNLFDYSYTWKQSYGYDIVEKGLFSKEPVLQFIYIIKKGVKNNCGEQSIDITYLFGKFDNNTIYKLESKLVENAKNKNLPAPEVGYFRVKTPYIGIIKHSKYCAENKKDNYSYTVMEAKDENEINTSIQPSANQSQISDKSVYKIISTNTTSQPNYTMENFLKTLKELLGEDSPLISKFRSANSGIRD